MNWLGHFAVLENPDPLTAVGGALADLGHDLEPRLRAPALLDALAGADDAPARALSLGVRAHLAADACFHDHPRVIEKMTQVRLRLHAPEFSALPRRREFIAHLMVEMALDAAWVAVDAELPVRFIGCISASHCAAASLRLKSAFGDRHAGIPELLENFSRRIPGLADQRPETLTQRLGRSLVYRLKTRPEDLPAAGLTDLFATVIEEWKSDVAPLQVSLKNALAEPSAGIGSR